MSSLLHEGDFDPARMRSYADAVATLPLTYRQADYLARSGYIATEFVDRRDGLGCDGGYGTARVIAPGEVAVLRMYVRVVALGMSGKDAVDVARALVAHGEFERAGLRVVAS